MDEQRRRRGEVDHRVGRGEQGRRVVADREALGADPGEVAEVLADHGAEARELRAAGKRAAIRLVDDARHHAAHAAGTADDADPERFHPQSPRIPCPWALPPV